MQLNSGMERKRSYIFQFKHYYSATNVTWVSTNQVQDDMFEATVLREYLLYVNRRTKYQVGQTPLETGDIVFIADDYN